MKILIDELVEKFEKKIPEMDEEKDELLKAFKNHLKDCVEVTEDSKYSNNGIAGKKAALEFEATFFIESDINIAKQILLEDKKMNEIWEISSNIYKLAIQKLCGEKDYKKADYMEISEKIVTLSGEVRSFNKENAKRLVSETILDLNYLNEPDSQIYSLRLYHFKKSIEKNKTKEEER